MEFGEEKSKETSSRPETSVSLLIRQHICTRRSCLTFPFLLSRMSAFLRYSKTRRSKVKKEFPDIDNTDISRLLGKMWNRASEEEKRPYVTQELRESEYYSSITPEVFVFVLQCF